MGVPRFETPVGVIDGANTVFTVSLPYVPGSTAVWRNGILLERTLVDGWVETDPTTGVITLNEAPKAIGACLDVIQVFYKDNLADAPETIVTELCAVVDGEANLVGSLDVDATGVQGTLTDTTLDIVLIDNTVLLQGSLEASCDLVGILIGEDC